MQINSKSFIDNDYEDAYDRADERRSKRVLLNREERRLFRDHVRHNRKTARKPERGTRLVAALEL